MDSQTAIETFKINSTQKPFYNVIEPPINHYKPINGLSDLSFSTYLNNENSTTTTTTTTKAHQTPSLDDPEINVFDAQKYFSETNNDSKEAKKIEPGLGSGSSNIINPGDSASRISSVSSSYGRNFRVRSFHSTPTASSEASWNSQIGLLSKPHGCVSVSLRNVSVHHHSNKRSGSSGGKWFFCRKCPCAGKKSLEVVGELETSTTRTSSMGSDNYQSNFHQPKIIQTHRKSNERTMQLQKLSNISLKTPTPTTTDDFPERHHLKMGFNNSSRISSENNFILSNDVLLKRVRASSSAPTAFSFPVLKHSNTYTKKETKSNKSSFEDPARESLEVFQPPQLSRKNIEDDVASDASSDLFEIESFSTQTASIYRKRDSLDEASTLNSIQRFGADNNFNNDHEPITPRTECYAPSEVSVDWSVTTAEGFDKASVTNYSITPSEYEDLTISRLRSMEKYGVQMQSSSNSNLHWNEGGGGGGGGGGNGKKKAVGNGLLGCRHENAVNVGPNPVKFVKEIPPILPLISTSGHVNGGASRPPKPNLTQSSSRAHARLSLAFAA